MSDLAQLLSKNESQILKQWIGEMTNSTRRGDLMRDEEFLAQTKRFLNLFTEALQKSGDSVDLRHPEFRRLTDFAADMSATRASQGFSPSETAMFVFSLKKPLFGTIRQEWASDPKKIADTTWHMTELLDNLGLNVMESFQKAREEVISRQQQELLELSTPVVKLWDRVLALPLIGTLDSQRTQVVMETLLQQIVADGAEVAIIDITGVPTVDTLVAQHLLKTVTAARLMGADCIISGIRPSTAQTIVHLGVDLQDVMTKATLADAFRVAMQRLGLKVTRKTTDKNGKNYGQLQQPAAASKE